MRTVNQRGEGGRLYSDIVAAAIRLIDANSSERAITLRSVAREAGITAPAIYQHFDGLDEIIAQAVELSYEDLSSQIVSETAELTNPVERLVSGCRRYVEFGREHRLRYVLMTRQSTPGPATLATFALLRDWLGAAIAEGESASHDLAKDAAALWVGLHGMALLSSDHDPRVWEPGLTRHDVLTTLVFSAAHLHADRPTDETHDS